MAWLIGFGLWWTFDDTLAEAVGNPGIGAIPWWAVFLAFCTLRLVATGSLEERVVEAVRKGKK